MFVIAVWGRKGGSGKTTLVASLGAYAMSQGRRVILLDFDTPRSLEAWSWGRRKHGPTTKRLPLSSLECILADFTAPGNTDDSENWDCLLDLPNSLGGAEFRALALANLVLIPVRPSFLDLNAAASSIEICRAAEARVAVVLTQVRSHGQEAAKARATLAKLADVLEPEICDLEAYPKAISSGLGPTEFEPSGQAASEIRALDDALTILRRNHGK